MLRYLLLAGLFLHTITLPAQFHTLTLPQPSPKVVETQTLGITEITMEYSAPAVRGRDLLTQVIPFEGEPVAWRAGANLNTRIQFSTDVEVEGNAIPAGSYGLHFIPHRDGKWTLILAQQDNLWGSYYLQDEDVFQRIDLTVGKGAFREYLSYEFGERTDSTIVVALEWGELKVPFTVTVDLNSTVLAQLHYELRGENTNRWEAWNDAARWCLDHQYNLEEALSWADRSINGGFGGFAANKNLSNLGTKVELLAALGRTDEIEPLLEEAKTLATTDAGQIFNFGRTLLKAGAYTACKNFLRHGQKKHPDAWFLALNIPVADYFLGDLDSAITGLNAIRERANTPSYMKDRIGQIMEAIKAGTYQIP
ncbi:DUF2911 domain-containing protein [Flavilitoribacter nigricans]|uniref:DUF2911 domain-containing protein n=1 Tax=Flavilitoribacter nigricans (strain ATCC 23147 / DSM 23189 / NBRC 102662 / NCIMB 1420 / SS-2) TaxID=1122177 RepID=A0A2D0NCE9_FLAN2|nr:DUF2911 domain-containing protein [Flavilitoribacter nigricans]PHN06050.1 hypothetical protein CRP01_13855 [Flavilitoribacter nigricans DSM 23189 = NBRC 102662]